MRLSLHMMVINGASVLPRALRPLRGIVDEVVAIDTGSTDGTPDVIKSLANELGMDYKLLTQSPSTNPGDYFLDSPNSFAHYFSSVYSGGYIPVDWARLRNRSLNLCTGDYVLKLDADDEVLSPGDILPTLEFLETHPNIDIVMSPYETMSTVEGRAPAPEHTSMYTRLWRNSNSIRFAEVCHENVDHMRLPDGSNWVMTHTGLTVRDWRDSKHVRIQHRNFKVLLREYERLKAAGQAPSKHLLYYLAEEGIDAEPEFVINHLIPVILGNACNTTEDYIWGLLIGGQCWARLKGFDNFSIDSFNKAVNLGSPRARLLQGMLKFQISLVCVARQSGNDGLVAALLAQKNTAVSKELADLPREKESLALCGGWIGDLEDGLSECEKKMWPFGATKTEIQTARAMLAHRK